MLLTNVAKFAAELKMPSDVLLEQLRAAGVNKTSPQDGLTEADKEQLLSALRRAHGVDDALRKKKITLTRKQTTEIKQADGSGKARTIQVEVRKKRVFVQREGAELTTEAAADAAAAAAAEAAAEASAAEADRLAAEEEERNRELLEQQAAELRAKEEALEREREREREGAVQAARVGRPAARCRPAPARPRAPRPRSHRRG